MGIAGANRRVAVTRRKLQGTGQAVVANIDDMVTAFQGVQLLLEHWGNRTDLRGEVLTLEQFQRRQASGTGHGVSAVGVTMGKLDGMLRATGMHEGVENLRGGNHGPHGHRPIGDLFSHVHDIRRDAKRFGPGGRPTAAKGGNDFIKNQQNIVGGADLPQPIQIAFWRHNHPRRARHGLHDYGGNGRRIVQGNLIQQRIGQLSAGFRLATSIGMARLQRMGRCVTSINWP